MVLGARFGSRLDAGLFSVGGRRVIRYELDQVHPDYRKMLPPLFEDVRSRYPRMALTRVFVGPPRRPGDVSMGFYDEDAREVRLNLYWFARSPGVLKAAAASPPLFHGPMIEEPRHVVTHECFHAIQRSVPGIEPRLRAAWEAATREPELMPADYGLTDMTEHFAELGALVDMGLATDEQRAMLRWVVEG